MKNKAILSILLFVFTYTKAEGQTIVYTYNAQGSCTSRVIKENGKFFHNILNLKECIKLYFS